MKIHLNCVMLHHIYLNILNVIVEQQLHKHWNDVLLTNQLTIVLILGENVQCADRSLDNLLHTNTVGISSRLLGATRGHRRALLLEELKNMKQCEVS